MKMNDGFCVLRLVGVFTFRERPYCGRAQMNYVRRGLILLLALNIAQYVNGMAAARANSVATNQPRHYAPVLPNRKGQIRLNRKLKKELDDWISIFAHGELQPFGRNNVKDEILIDFALERIFRYVELKEPVATQGNEGIDEKSVEAMVAKYFEARIKQHKTPHPRRNDPESQREYKNGRYFPAPNDNAWGETGFEFAKVRRLKGIGDRYYEVTVDVYFGYEGPTDVPVDVQLLSRMRAIFKYVPANSASKYLLVSYEKIR
jgi:hypothetical protein